MYDVKPYPFPKTAITLIEEWGYPRPMTDDDKDSIFLQVGDFDALVWFHPLKSVDVQDIMAIHMAKNPKTRGETMGIETWPQVVEFGKSQGWKGFVMFKSGEPMVEFVESLGFNRSASMQNWHIYDLR